MPYAMIRCALTFGLLATFAIFLNFGIVLLAVPLRPRRVLVVAGVLLDYHALRGSRVRPLSALNDSKQHTAEGREELYPLVMRAAAVVRANIATLELPGAVARVTQTFAYAGSW